MAPFQANQSRRQRASNSHCAILADANDHALFLAKVLCAQRYRREALVGRELWFDNLIQFQLPIPSLTYQRRLAIFQSCERLYKAGIKFGRDQWGELCLRTRDEIKLHQGKYGEACCA